MLTFAAKNLKHMKPTLLILAAGIGSRYGGLKQVDGIGPAGEAIIEYSIYDAIRAGFGKVVLVIRKGIEAEFKAKFASKFQDQIEVRYAFQEIDSPIEGIDHFPERVKPWGTGHAVLVAASEIQEPFAVINADDYYGITGFQSIADFLREKCTPEAYCMVGYIIKNTLSDNGTVSRGVCEMDEHNHLITVVERHKVQALNGQVQYQDENGKAQALKEDDIVSMNLWGFHPNVFEVARKLFIDFVKTRGHESKSEFYIPYVANHLLETNAIKLTVLPNDERWYGITYKEDRIPVEAAFRRLVDEGRYPAPLWDKE